MNFDKNQISIKPYFTEVLEQAQIAIRPPFVVPKDFETFKNQTWKNIRTLNYLYESIIGFGLLLASLFAHPVIGILLIVVYVALFLTWKQYIEKYVKDFMSKYDIRSIIIPVLLTPIFFIFALFTENVACFLITIILTYLIVFVHALLQKFGTKERLEMNAKKMGKKVENSFDQLGDKLK